MKEFGVYFYEISIKGRDMLTLGVAFTDTEENGINQLSQSYQNLNYIELKEVWSWNEFKRRIGTDGWPEIFKDNDSGLFEFDEFAVVCEFARNIYIPLLEISLRTNSRDN